MNKNELSVPGILRKYQQTGELPHEMLPIKPAEDEGEDPTKPLRGSIEAIVGIRVAIPTFGLLTEMLDDHGLVAPNLPLAEIEKYAIYWQRSLLAQKIEFIGKKYRDALTQVITSELDPSNRDTYPDLVSDAYDKYTETLTVEDIAPAVLSLLLEINTLFVLAKRKYPEVLGKEPSASQMTYLIGNSYQAYIHLLAAQHRDNTLSIDTYFGSDVEINTETDKHFIAIRNPERFVHKEAQLRETGRIQSQRIKCPFSIGSEFTKGFLDPGAPIPKNNPLRYTFETLVRDYIGS